MPLPYATTFIAPHAIPVTSSMIVTCMDMDGHAFCVSYGGTWRDKWEVISRSFADNLKCHPDDLECELSDADAEEPSYITLNGERVGTTEVKFVSMPGGE